MLQVKTRRGDGEGEEEQQELVGRSSSRSWRGGAAAGAGGGRRTALISIKAADWKGLLFGKLICRVNLMRGTGDEVRGWALQHSTL